MKSQHCSAQPGRQSRTTLFKAGDPSEAQPLLHMHKPWLDTGPTPGINPSWFPGQPSARTCCTALTLGRWPVSTRRSKGLDCR